MPTPDSWLTPEWPAPAHVRAVFTSREGGVSEPPFDDFNLGDHVGDHPVAVATNRQLLAEALAVRPVFLKQVHGTAVADLDDLPEGDIVADGCIGTRPGAAATIMVADCLPILLTDTQGHAVAAAHAGWRGLAGQGKSGKGIVETTVAALRQRVDSQSELLAWLGPCIGPTAFEVGSEVREAFCANDLSADVHFQPVRPGKYLADLAGLARHRLQAIGVRQISGNDGSSAWCTVGRSSVFFSHRRDAARLGSTGRMAACIWLDARGV